MLRHVTTSCVDAVWAGGHSAGESGWLVGTSQVRWAAGEAGGAGGERRWAGGIFSGTQH